MPHTASIQGKASQYAPNTPVKAASCTCGRAFARLVRRRERQNREAFDMGTPVMGRRPGVVHPRKVAVKPFEESRGPTVDLGHGPSGFYHMGGCGPTP